MSITRPLEWLTGTSRAAEDAMDRVAEYYVSPTARQARAIRRALRIVEHHAHDLATQILRAFRHLAVVACAVIAAATVATTPAAAQPAERDATFNELRLQEAPAVTQRLSNRICRWLAARRFDVAPCPQVWVSPDLPAMVARSECPGRPVAECPAAQGVAGIATRSGTVVPPTWALPELPPGMPSANDILLHTHELLHRVQGAKPAGVTPGGLERIAIWDWTPTDLYWEEAIVEAVSHDLHAGIERRLYPGWGPARGGALAYPNAVRHLRAMTARATHGSWKARPARSLRAALLRADINTRRDAIASMTTKEHR